jgi:hypothetical protein
MTLRRPGCAVASAWVLASFVVAGAPPSQAQVIDRIDAIAPYMDDCVVRALQGQGFEGRDLTLRFAFRRNGTIIGDPAITYSRPPRTEPEQMRFIAALRAALKRCAPLPFSNQLGAVIAGKIFTFRYTLTTEKDQSP